MMYVSNLSLADMNRIFIDLPQPQFDALAQIVELQQRPRAAVIRDAIEAYIANHPQSRSVDAFGAWRAKGLDGLDYQQALRSNW